MIAAALQVGDVEQACSLLPCFSRRLETCRRIVQMITTPQETSTVKRFSRFRNEVHIGIIGSSAARVAI